MNMRLKSTSPTPGLGRHGLRIALASCLLVIGCAPGKKVGGNGQGHEKIACHQGYIEPTPIRSLFENPGIGDFSPSIIFGAAKSDIHPSAQPALDSIAIFLKTTTHNYFVMVHSDKNGPRDRVFSLSEKRATSIVNYLVEKGVEKERLDPVGAGWKCFIGDQNSLDDQRRSRRVEFIRIPPESIGKK